MDVAEHLTRTGVVLGTRATVVQLSSAFCAPCRAARSVAARVADTADGVAHVDLDVAGHEVLAEALDVRTTPVLLVLDGTGRTVARTDAVPRLAWLRAAVEVAVAGDGG